MRIRLDLTGQLGLGPAKAFGGNKIPAPFLRCQIRLHDHDILRPAQLHGQSCYLRIVLIGTIEIPHPAHTSGRETSLFGIAGGQILGSGHRGTFFRTEAYRLSNGPIQLHLGQICHHDAVQNSVHFCVVNGLSDIHGVLLSGVARQFYFIFIWNPMLCRGTSVMFIRCFGSTMTSASFLPVNRA